MSEEKEKYYIVKPVMKVTGFNLERRQIDKIERMVAKYGLNKSELIRMAIDALPEELTLVAAEN